jgi:hypothetical protein
MVENLTKSPWTCSDGPRSAWIKSSKVGAFSMRESKKEKQRSYCGLGRRARATGLSLRVLEPTSARHAWTVRDAPTDSLRGAQTVLHPGANGPLFAPECPVLLLFPTRRVDGPRCPGGQSAINGRTVRPTTAEGPTSLFNFSLIYSETKIWESIFWDHCSKIMKETCHVMQWTN